MVKNILPASMHIKEILHTLQIHFLSFCEHLITSAASCTAGMVVLISCLRKQKRLFIRS